MITFLTIAVIVLFIIDIYLYVCLYNVVKLIKILSEKR